MARTEEQWREREAEARLPGWPPIPDGASPVLTISGAEWTIPPRGGVMPVFSGESVSLHGGATPWDAAAAEILETAPVQEEAERCPACGQSIGAYVGIGPDSMDWLGLVFKLAAVLLRSRYGLSDAELSDLLTIRNGTPDWIRQLLAWCANG